MNAKEFVFDFLKKAKPGTEFTGYDLANKVQNKLGEIHYPDTLLRYVREYRQKFGVLIPNIDKKKSRYRVA